MPAKTQPAVAFYRKNGDGRYAKPLEAHRKAIREFATAAGYNIAAEFADKLVPGRFGKGFTSLLKYVETTGAPTVIVAASSEFATDPIDRAVAYAVLLNIEFVWWPQTIPLPLTPILDRNLSNGS